MRVSLGLVIVLVFLLHNQGPLHMNFIDRMESFAYDARLNLTMPGGIDRRIVVVDIDEKSLAEQGRWPWSRNKLAQLMDNLFGYYKVSVLGFDVVFAEKDDSSGYKTLEKIGQEQLRGDANFNQALEKIKPTLDYDQMFADSIQGRKIVMGYYFQLGNGKAGGSGMLPKPVFPAGTFDPDHIFVVGHSYGANLPVLQQNAFSAGHFNPDVDADGISRRIAMVEKFEGDGSLYESLSLGVARAYLGADKVEADFVPNGTDYASLEGLKVGDRYIPVDDHARALIPFRGKQRSFPYVSATDVLNKKVDPKILDGAIILVGTTAPGLLDLRASPVESVYPGVEMHANMVAGILDQNIKQSPAYLDTAEFLLLFVLGVALAIYLAILSPLWGTLWATLAMGGTMGLNLWLWNSQGLAMSIVTLWLMMTSLYLFNMSYGFFVESRAKRQMTGLFGQYVPPELVDEMAKDPTAISMEGDSREMTVLFSDVRGFTTISEGLDPKELTQLMNEYLSPMTYVIQKHRGTIDKYMGDAIMAFWGAPLLDPDNAKHALEAAIGMIEELKVVQTAFEAKGWPPIKIGVGLNTGVMTVGNMGSTFRMAYTVMGDAVNLGSRLESITKQYGVYIIVSEFTKAKVPDFVYRELDKIRVKGKDEPVAIFEPIGPVGSVDQATLDELERYRHAVDLYAAQKWDEAEAAFKALHEGDPSRYLYDHVYLERIAHFRVESPGEGWDGVYTFQTK
ncbi:MAG TPA: adenylate/guanylate cyclase domain-containing protein [Methylophilaceae bacterium]